MKNCVVLGASGLIGQQFVRLLAQHPKLSLVGAYSSSRSSGKKLRDIWGLPGFNYPEELGGLELQDLDTIGSDFDIAFSGLPADIALNIENKLREQGIAVFSNASAYRMEQNVPILIPEINKEHINLVNHQKEKLGTTGFIITNANCSVTGAAIYLHELGKLISTKTAFISTYQATSGAGLTGVSSLQIANNVIPFIKNEEYKMTIEAKKILGIYQQYGKIEDAQVNIIANCARVPVIDGHLESITTELDIDSNLISSEEIASKLSSVISPIYDPEKYFIAPERHVIYLNGNDRPQPAKDVYAGTPRSAEGMVVSIGRIRISGNYLSAFILVHNTIRGGAGGSILNAEYAIQEKIL